MASRSMVTHSLPRLPKSWRTVVSGGQKWSAAARSAPTGARSARARPSGAIRRPAAPRRGCSAGAGAARPGLAAAGFGHRHARYFAFPRVMPRNAGSLPRERDVRIEHRTSRQPAGVRRVSAWCAERDDVVILDC
jgi:hypothetical protein